MRDASVAERAHADAVEAAYEAFAPYRVGAIGFCACCHTKTGELVTALRGGEPRALPAIEVAEFFNDVFWTASADLESFKALVPRALDLAPIGAGEIEHLALATFAKKLNLARWRSWPPAERDAVDGWARAWFDASLACSDAHADSLEDVLCALGIAYGDLAPFLTLLREGADDDTRKLAAHLVLSICFSLSHARAPLPADWSSVGSYWEKGSLPERQMLTWLATHASAERLIADATAGGCDCFWVCESTVPDVRRALATFAERLSASLLCGDR